MRFAGAPPGCWPRDNAIRGLCIQKGTVPATARRLSCGLKVLEDLRKSSRASRTHVVIAAPPPTTTATTPAAATTTTTTTTLILPLLLPLPTTTTTRTTTTATAACGHGSSGCSCCGCYNMALLTSRAGGPVRALSHQNNATAEPAW